MNLQDKRYDQLAFLDYLKLMKDDISQIGDDQYGLARDFVRHITTRLITEKNLSWQNYMNDEEGNWLYSNNETLDRYNYAKSNKAKLQVMNEFKTHLKDDLNDMIIKREM